MRRLILLLSSITLLMLLSNCTPHQFSGGAAPKCAGWFGPKAGCVSNRSKSYTSSSKSSYSSSQAKPVLFYDDSTGGMRECAYVPGASGKCNSFKPFNAKAYSNQTLFYNASKGSMQPCIGSVTFQGKCTSFGLYRNGLASNNQLFYDPNSNKMTTCRHVSAIGKCLALDISPRKGTTGGTFIVDDPTNPYKKKVPESSEDLIKLGESMISGSCTLGVNC
jgi:hypothetical protein